jgi:hypothetical protein
VTSFRQDELLVPAGHDAPQSENIYLRDAATLLQQMVAEIAPLAQFNATMATVIEAMQRDIEALIPVVEFIPTLSENSPCLNELKELAKARIARLAAELEQIADHTHEAIADCTTQVAFTPGPSRQHLPGKSREGLRYADRSD